MGVLLAVRGEWGGDPGCASFGEGDVVCCDLVDQCLGGVEGLDGVEVGACADGDCCVAGEVFHVFDVDVVVA